MEKRLIMFDTSILIDFYRKTDKANTVWFKLVKEGYEFEISVVTKYEIFVGANENQLKFWNEVMLNLSILELDDKCVTSAIEINKSLKEKRKQIDIADLFIGATAIANNLPFSTLNLKHFERIDDIRLVK